MRDFSKCPRCNHKTKYALSFSGANSEFWLECTRCNTYINTYIPQEHQEHVHQDEHRFTGNFGGYGSGKTLTSREEFYKHALLTDDGNTLIGANVQSQYEQTIKRDIESDLPVAFVKNSSTQKQYIDLINGHRLMYRPFDDPNKLRSYNLSMFIIVEASEVKPEAFNQLKSRLRNTAATLPKMDEDGNVVYKETKRGVTIPVIEHDWRKGIVESNPDAGWIRSDVLMKADDIQKHGEVYDTYGVLEEESDPAISAHVTATNANEFLPPSFIDDLVKNKPPWWVNRYVNGSFQYAEGLVYPSALKYAVPADIFPQGIPRHWKRIVAFDYGLSDDAVFLFGAVDELHSLLYIYKEIRVNDRNVEELSRLFLEGCKDIPVGGWICPPIIDPKSASKRDYEKKNLADHFLDYGINFKPGQVSLDARVYRLNTYFECGKLRILDSCEGLVKELRDYKFAPKTSDSTAWQDKPEDKNNHAINCLEWICMELPADPQQLVYGIYNKEGYDVNSKPKTEAPEHYAFHILSDEQETTPEPGGAFDMIDYTF